MKLYLIHAGFYDPELCSGIYESHANFFVAAESFEEARKKAKTLEDFRRRRMHIDGVQEISVVDGHEVSLLENPLKTGLTQISSLNHRDLSP